MYTTRTLSTSCTIITTLGTCICTHTRHLRTCIYLGSNEVIGTQVKDVVQTNDFERKQCYVAPLRSNAT